MHPGEQQDEKKNEAADEGHPVQAHQGSAHYEARGVNRKLAERYRSQNGAEEDEGAEPDAEHEIDQRVKESTHR